MSIGVDDDVIVAAEPSGYGTGYRYPGSPPFQDNDLDRELFQGRAKEADTVLQSILSSNLLALYSVSGLGKTSLINAGVMHRLRERGHWPASVRLNDPTMPIVELIGKGIEAAARADPTIELVRDPSAAPATADSNLWNMLASLEVWRRNDLQQLVIVLDQFEELFTLGWHDGERRKFIEQFGEVVRGFRLEVPQTMDGAAEIPPPPPRVKFVIVIREDSLGQLEALSRDVPQIMHNRFRLEPLRLDQAEAAIREPARLVDQRLDTQRFEYTEAASSLILDFLRTRTVRGAVVHSDAVDPSQLQIVCQYVERAILPRKKLSAAGGPIEIDEKDLGGRAGLDGVLRHFYQRTLQKFSTTKQQRAVRDLCESGLINRNRRRLSLEEGEIGGTFGVTPEDLKQLVDERLLRADPRLDSVYYELAHDTLIDPIVDYRDEQRVLRAHRRRRWIFAGMLAVLAVAVGALVIVVLQPDRADEPDHLELGLGQRVSGVVGGSGETPFALNAPADTATLVTITPDAQEGEPLDLAIEVASPNGTTRQDDRFGPGQPERVVVPPATRTGGTSIVGVSSLNSASGSFTVVAEPLDVTEIAPLSNLTGRIVDPGGVSVYRLAGGGPTPIVVDVTPVFAGVPYGGSLPDESSDPEVTNTSESQKETKPPTGLDVNVEIIDPSGTATRVDAAGADQIERFAVTGPAGSYLLVVRGYQTSVGDFMLNLSESESLVRRKGQHLEIAPPDRPVNLAFGATGPEPYLARVMPSDGVDVRLEIVRPDAAVVATDSAGPGGEEAAIIAGLGGHYVLSVRGDPTGGKFDVEVVPIESAPLPVGTWTSMDGGEVLEIPGGEEPLTILVDPPEGVDPILQVMDLRGTTRSVDRNPAGGIEATIVTAERPHMIRMSDFEGATSSVDVIAIPATSAEHLSAGETVMTAVPAVFDVDVDDDHPLLFEARPDTIDGLVDIQVLDPDGVPVATASAGASAPDGTATATVGGVRPGRYRVVVSASAEQNEITASLSPIASLVDGETVTAAGPRVFLVEIEADETKVVTADSTESVLAIQVLSPQGYTTALDTARSTLPGEPVTTLVGGFGPGPYQVRVGSSDEQSDVTTALAAVAGQALTSGETVTARGPAARFDVDVTGVQLLEFRADSDSPTGVLDTRVVDPEGFRYDASAAQPQPLPDALPPEIVELFPRQVVELFEQNGLPDTIDEATRMLTDAGLLDAVLEVLRENPKAEAAIYSATSSPAGASVTTIVGGRGSGPYQVFVSSSDPAREITATLIPIQAQPLVPGATVTATAPAAFDVEIAAQPRLVTARADSADDVVSIEVLDPVGTTLPGSSASSGPPGQPATAIVGAYSSGTYRVIVMSSHQQSAVVVQLE